MEEYIKGCQKNNKFDIRDQGKVKSKKSLGYIKGEYDYFKFYDKKQICKKHSSEKILLKINHHKPISLTKYIDDKYIWFPPYCNQCLYEIELTKEVIDSDFQIKDLNNQINDLTNTKESLMNERKRIIDKYLKDNEL